ncbi:MAG TPA: TIGR00269 family protein [Methanoregula sp.]|nr:TIGR00269 family protein [Methanoregula sp.]
METKAVQPDVPECSFCTEPAVVCQRYHNRHLCGTHFTADVELRVADTIKTRQLIVPQDRVAVALSGGKDSTALLLLLHRLLPAWEDVRLIAITIDEGIAGYREETIQSAERLTGRLGIEHHCIAFTSLFGESLDAFLTGRETQACSICGILRKKALVVGAHQAGATKLATGHNLDDEAQSVLMNVFRGDLPRLVRNSRDESSGKFIPRIKPLSRISEKEIATYLMLNDAWNELPECPYTRYAMRREVRSMLSGFEYKHPGTMLNLVESKEKIERCAKGSVMSEPIHSCRECGDPCSGDLCQVCLLRQSLER